VIGLHSGQARFAIPMSGALVLGVGVGSAIGWVAGGPDATPEHRAVVSGATAAASAASVFTASGMRPLGLTQDARAVALLRRADLARTAIPWSGTQVVTTWSSDGTTTRIVDLSHQPGQGTAARVHATTAEDEDRTFIPDADGPDASPAEVSAGPLDLLTRAYSLRDGSSQLVAGRRADKVLALRDNGSIAARFWVDRSTGLLLRRELVDPKGWVTHSTVFIDVRPGKAVDLDSGGDITRPWTTEITHARLDAMRDAGWVCPDQMPGGLMLYDIRSTPSATDPVLHLAYSDGLVNVSVFEERGHLDAAALRGYTLKTVAGRAVHVRIGTAEELTWQSEGRVYTVLADAPEASVAAVVASLPSPSSGSGGGGWSRVRRGLHRMGSWIDPSG
jgi:sigma-E factor negative regulatory protein RseB